MFQNLQIPKFKDLIRQLKAAHFNALFDQLDAVQKVDWNRRKPAAENNNSASNGSTTNYTFLSILIVFVTLFVDSILGLQYEYAPTFDLRDLPTSPYIMLHQIPPKLMWLQTDMLMLSNTITTAVVYAILVRHWQLAERYRIYPLNNGQNLIVDSRGLFGKFPGSLKKKKK